MRFLFYKTTKGKLSNDASHSAQTVCEHVGHVTCVTHQGEHVRVVDQKMDQEPGEGWKSISFRLHMVQFAVVI